MAVLDGFVGGTYQALSPAAAADVCINLFKETRRDGDDNSAKTEWLLGTPGLKVYARSVPSPERNPTGNITVALGVGSLVYEGREAYVVTNSTAVKGMPPGVLAFAGLAPTVVIGADAVPRCRGNFYQDGLTLTTIGTTISRVDTVAKTLHSLGYIPDNGEPVSYASNGKGGDQIAIVGGDQLNILDTSTMTMTEAVTLPFTSPVMVVFMDGYFLINQRNTPTTWFSALEDGLSWDALDFIARSGTSDNVIGIGVAQDRVWVFGSKTTTLFYDSGDADTPFLPYPGTTTQIGCVTPWGITHRGDIFTWLAQDSDGLPSVVSATGTPTPTRVSTPPIEQWLRACTTLATAEALTYQQDGHIFYALTAPGSVDDVQTYVYDAAERAWGARAGWDSVTGRFTRWSVRGVAHVNGLVLVGRFDTGTLYELDMNTLADDGDVIRRVRRMPYVSKDPSTWLFLDQIELLCQVGIGLQTGQGANPLADLRLSRDLAETWVAAGEAALGRIGVYLTRSIWRRLGRVRADRLVIEVSQSDPVKVAWLGLSLKSTGGLGQA